MLNSYYGTKLFIRRSDKMVFNYQKWLTRHLFAMALNAEDQRVTNAKFSDVFNREVKGSSVYAGLSRSFSGFTAGSCEMTFDYADHQSLPYVPSAKEVKGSTGNLLYCGTRLDQQLFIDELNQIFAYSPVSKDAELLGSMESICEIPPDIANKRPIEIVELQLSGKQLPIGVVLGWRLGLKNMIKFTGIDARLYDRYGETRYKPLEDEFHVTFEDSILVATKGDRKAEYIIGSLLKFKNQFKAHPARVFETPEGWQAIIAKAGLGNMVAWELKNVYDLYIDPVTEDILKVMGEPTEMTALFLRATEMLLDDSYKSPTDFTEMRDRGYERIAGYVYQEMVQSVRKFRSRSIVADSQVTMNPNGVWMKLVEDPACSVVEESNPIHNVKEKDVVIYGGIGGRTARTLTERFRTYNETDLGVTGDGTVENGDVGTTMYLSSDPQYANVYGMRKKDMDKSKLTPANMQSFATMATPGSDRDDKQLSA